MLRHFAPRNRILEALSALRRGAQRHVLSRHQSEEMEKKSFSRCILHTAGSAEGTSVKTLRYTLSTEF